MDLGDVFAEVRDERAAKSASTSALIAAMFTPYMNPGPMEGAARVHAEIGRRRRIAEYEIDERIPARDWRR